jgi:hypothetical protein
MMDASTKQTNKQTNKELICQLKRDRQPTPTKNKVKKMVNRHIAENSF